MLTIGGFCHGGQIPSISYACHKATHNWDSGATLYQQQCIYLPVFIDDVQKLSELVSLNILLLSKNGQHTSIRILTTLHW